MKKVITERNILDLEKQGIKVLEITEDTVITPLALDRIRSSKFSIIEKKISQTEPIHTSSKVNSISGKRIIIAATTRDSELKIF